MLHLPGLPPLDPTQVGIVPWKQLLRELSAHDQCHLTDLIERFRRFLADQPLSCGCAIVTVGSVLNLIPRHHPRDIDLLLLPLKEDDLNLAERLFRQFLAEQPEAVDPDGRLYDHQHPGEMAITNRCWDFPFSGGRTIQFFLKQGTTRCTFAHFVTHEVIPHRRRCACHLFSP